MTKFVVAKINFFDNNLTQHIVERNSLEEAYFHEANNDDIWCPELLTIDDIKQEYFNVDMMINIIMLG